MAGSPIDPGSRGSRGSAIVIPRAPLQKGSDMHDFDLTRRNDRGLVVALMPVAAPLARYQLAGSAGNFRGIPAAIGALAQARALLGNAPGIDDALRGTLREYLAAVEDKAAVAATRLARESLACGAAERGRIAALADEFACLSGQAGDLLGAIEAP